MKREYRTSEKVFRKLLTDLKTKGKQVRPRDLLVTELENHVYTLPPYVRFCNFEARKLNVPYIKREFLWYLRGVASDLEITNHASMWKSLVREDKTINSNYGQYIFSLERDDHISGLCQFDAAVKLLGSDKDSRRASMVILKSKHVKELESKDVPCTYALNFRIRDNKLKMTVHMRSQDAIFGMGNDAPCFSFIHEMMYVTVRDTYYPELEMGEYCHFADSFHLYERHFEMLDKIVDGSPYVPVECPKISSVEEVKFLRKWIHASGYLEKDFFDWDDSILSNISRFPELQEMIKQNTERFPFAKWLITF